MRDSGNRKRPKPDPDGPLRRVEELSSRLAEAKARLAEAEEALRAIRGGEVDALVVSAEQGERVYTLSGAERPYRILIEAMGEGAATLAHDGTVLYANQAFAEIVGMPLEKVVGSSLSAFLPPGKGPGWQALLSEGASGSLKREAVFLTEAGAEVPVLLAATPLPESDPPQVCCVVTDLSDMKRREVMLFRLNAELQVEIEKRRESEAAVRREHAFREAVAESLAVGLVTVDTEGKILSVNDAFSTMTGWSKKDLLRMKPPYAFWHPEEAERYGKEYLQMIKGRRIPPAGAEIRFLRRDGESRDILIHASPLRDGQGAVRGYVASFTDITERKEAELSLAESEARFRSLVEHSLVGFFLVQEGRVVFRNPEQDKLFGPVSGGLALKELAARVHPEDRERFLALCDADRRPEADRSETDLRLVGRDETEEPKTIRWVHGRAVPVQFRGKKANLVNTVDVTRIKELERLAVTREKMAALGQMAAGIAHEIRNPLSGLNLYLSTVRKILADADVPEPESRESAATTLEMMQSASNRIEMVVRKVMNFARPASPTMSLVDINQAVREAVHLSELVLRRNGIHIEAALAKDLPFCYADLQLVEQVLLNLITNAAQAMDRQEGLGRRKRIAVASFVEDGRIVITVADSGPGVPEDLREKIFDPHYTTKEGGAGIGLSFSRRIVMDHGGFLTVGTSALGGAEFRIELPAGDKRKAPRP
jgi:PAS domain S-box-containing protein